MLIKINLFIVGHIQIDGILRRSNNDEKVGCIGLEELRLSIQRSFEFSQGSQQFGRFLILIKI